MANADGSVVINTELDAKNAQKELTALEKKIDALNEKISDKKQEQMPLVEQSKQIAANLDAAKAQLDQMRNGDEFYTAGAIKEQEQTVKALQKEWDSVQNKVERMDTSIARDTRSLERMTNRAGDLSKQIMAAKENTKGISPAAQAASKQMDKFVSHVKTLAKRVLVFSLITKALRTLKSYMWSAIQTNDKAMAAVAKLKGALRTLAQPIVNVVVPAFTLLVDVITRVVNAISELVSMIFGTTAEESAKAAESLYEESDALDKTGKSAKKASKSLASFDEINKLSGSQEENKAPDFSTGINDQLSAIMELFAGAALLAIGAALAFSGVNVPLGIGLMAMGALAIWGAVSTDWSAIQNALKGPIGAVTGILSAALLAIGAIILFSGANIPLGLALMVAGAIGLATAVAANWDTIKALLQGPLGIVTAIISFALLEIGAILLFSGANIPLGLGLMVVGAIGMAAVIAANWDTIKALLQGPIGAVTAMLSASMLVLGAVLAFSGANVPIGLGLMIAGAIGLATSVAANWDTIQTALQGPIGAITALVSSALLVLGIILTLTGVALPIGIGLIAAGAVGLVATVAVNWNAITEYLGGPIAAIVSLVSSALLVLGVLLVFTGVGIPLGMGMIVAGAAGLASVAVINWDYLKNKLGEAWDGIKEWWNANVAKYFTIEYWQDLGKNIVDGLLNGLKSAFESVKSWASGAMDTIKSAFTGGSVKTSMPPINSASIPRLATGAVIPPNREFLAVLGDQKQGTNIEAPAAAIEAAVARGMAQYGGGNQTAILKIGEQELGRIIFRLNQDQAQRVGIQLT